MSTKTTQRKIKLNYFFADIANLSPSYFALVMATGIVSIAVHLYNYVVFAKTLFYINLVAYAILLVLFLARAIFYRKEFLSDFIDDKRNMGFLSFVAATCILGNQFLLIFNNYEVGIYFFIVGLLSWLFLTYLLFAIVIENQKKPSLQVISGTWLLLVVATQSVSVLGGRLQGRIPLFKEELLFLSLILFLCGCMFYIIITTLIVYRLIFFKLRAEDLGPPSWIIMGANAITVLAGSALIISADKSQILTELLPFLKGFTLLFWGFGTWWIPLMLVLGIWRHITNKVPLYYSPQYWGMVFPLGMYTVCTIFLSNAIKLPLLLHISSIFIIITVVAWSLVSFSLVYNIVFKVLVKKVL